MSSMKQTFVGIALVAAFGSAHAFDSVGQSTNDALLRVGPTTSTGFHGPVGAPGIGLGANESWYISLQSISLPFTNVGTTNGFERYQLLGYAHTPTNPPANTVDVNFNWVKVPTTGTNAKQVYFGLATDKNTNTTAAYYVGDKEDRVVPSGDTTYAAVALVALGGTDGTSPQVLQGNLNYNYLAQTLNSAGSLTDGTNNLALTTSVTGAGFTGNATYNTVSYTNSVNGEFFGGGANSGSSAVAGTVDGGSTFQASFGGIATN